MILIEFACKFNKGVWKVPNTGVPNHEIDILFFASAHESTALASNFIFLLNLPPLAGASSRHWHINLPILSNLPPFLPHRVKSQASQDL